MKQQLIESRVTSYLPFDFSTATPSTFGILPLCALFIAGTGGLYHISNIDAVRPFAGDSVLTICHAPRPRQLSSASVPFYLQRVRHALGINMTDLSTLLGVSRQAAYAWINGASPKADAFDKILMLNRRAQEIEAEKLPQMGLLVKRPLVGSPTLFELLASGSEITRALHELREYAALQREEMGRLRATGGESAATWAVADVSSSIYPSE